MTRAPALAADPADGPAAPAAAPPAALMLMWLASPALPVGGFSYSEGLEMAVDHGLVHDEATACAWLLDQLHLVQGRSELPLAAAAHAAWLGHDLASLQALNGWALSTRECAESRQQAEQMGRSLAEWLRHSPWSADPRLAQLSGLGPAPAWPLGFALAGVLAGATAEATLMAMAWSWAENMAQAAMKAVPLGQTAAQRILNALAAEVPGVTARALALPADERQAFAPMLAVLGSLHETQYSRLFRS